HGGAIGMVNFNGDMNTGLTLRTIRIKDGIAQVRAGATLLFDSIPEEEEAETELKASAMIAAVREAHKSNIPVEERAVARVG
ncbi:chorismate-binding protein, partial [Mycobacterium tuberculosis]|nr:chorismate-binding protein [Mycobacterium tuberculosis]